MSDSFCDPTDCNFPGSSVHGISQARILEWVAISFSRASSWLRDQTCIFRIAGRFFTTEPPGASQSFAIMLSPYSILFFFFFFCNLVWSVSTDISSGLLILSSAMSTLMINPLKIFFISETIFLFLLYSMITS